MIKRLDKDPRELNLIPGPATDFLGEFGLINLFVPLFPICGKWIISLSASTSSIRP